MDAPALAGLEHDLVHAERADPEPSPQREEALADVWIDPRAGRAVLHVAIFAWPRPTAPLRLGASGRRARRSAGASCGKGGPQLEHRGGAVRRRCGAASGRIGLSATRTRSAAPPSQL